MKLRQSQLVAGDQRITDLVNNISKCPSNSIADLLDAECSHIAHDNPVRALICPRHDKRLKRPIIPFRSI